MNGFLSSRKEALEGLRVGRSVFQKVVLFEGVVMRPKALPAVAALQEQERVLP